MNSAFRHITAGVWVVWAATFSGWAQGDPSGSPVSWNLLSGGVVSVPFMDLPDVRVAELLEEEAVAAEVKTIPWRFAESVGVQLSTAHDGEWRNLPNGDRIWLLGIRSEHALAQSVTFGHLQIPNGGAVYLYTSDRNSFSGPLTHAQNRLHQAFGTTPVRGEELIIEYYEPFAFRGQGELVITSVARSFREVSASALAQGDCMEILSDHPVQGPMGDAAASVLLLLVDNGQRAVTGVLVNNSAHDGEPLVLTAIQGLVGEPESWVAVHGILAECPDQGACWNRFISGAEIVEQDAATGLALLRLNEFPSRRWNAFLAGWALGGRSDDSYTCIQHAFAGPRSLAVYNGPPVSGDWGSFQALAIPSWGRGNTFPGSLGSPLFNAQGELVGIFVGGNGSCNGTGADYFGSLLGGWKSLGRHLDPFREGAYSLHGFYPAFDRAQAVVPESGLVIFPNPAQEQFYIQNSTGEPIRSVVLVGTDGREAARFDPELPVFDLGDLAPGVYAVNTVFRDRILTRRLVIR